LLSALQARRRSDILFAGMFRARIPAAIFLLALATLFAAAQSPAPVQAPLPAPAAPSAPIPLTPAVPPPPAVTVILDPAHGGADEGAHSEASDEGAVEKDLVLSIALAMRRELERQGFRVILTRQLDLDMSINDRAALANGVGFGFFITLHVGSGGQPNTAQAYSFGTPHGAAPPAFAPRPIGVSAVRWDDAQSGYSISSRRFAELLQVELAQKLPHSADVPQFAEVRQLRVVAHPAVAIELSSISEDNPDALTKTAAPLAAAIGRAITVYRQSSGGRP